MRQLAENDARPGLDGWGRAAKTAAVGNNRQAHDSTHRQWQVRRDGAIEWGGKDLGQYLAGWWHKVCSRRRGWWSWKYDGPGLQADVYDALRPAGVVFEDLDNGNTLRLLAAQFEAQRIEDTLNPGDGRQYFIRWPAPVEEATTEQKVCQPCLL